MPPHLDLRKTAPWVYLKHILNSKKKGTLHDYLLKRKWCHDVYIIFNNFYDECSSIFILCTLTLSYTIEGRKHIKDIIDAVFSFINKLDSEEPSERIFNETQKLKEHRFRFVT